MASCHRSFNILKRHMSVLQAEEGTGRILIARVMHGGAADRSGLIAVGDEVIEVSVYTTVSSLGRYVFGSEISYNKPPPRLPGLGC